MKLYELKSYFKNSLSGLYPSEEIQSFFNITSEKFLKLSRIEVALNLEIDVSEEISEAFFQIITRLKNHEPIQYILGETEFFDLPFKVNKHTLIPRPETEELVHWIISEFKTQHSGLRILDIGTGSGCIAISLAKNLPKSKLSAMDISSEALQIASQNAHLNAVEINFFESDILNAGSLPQQYNIIVSNPPYVRQSEKLLMQQNVLKYEPETALFVNDDDSLLFYRAILQLAKTHLKPDGKVFFEINEYLSEELKALAKKEGFKNIEIKKDIFGKYRMLKCNFHE